MQSRQRGPLSRLKLFASSDPRMPQAERVEVVAKRVCLTAGELGDGFPARYLKRKHAEISAEDPRHNGKVAELIHKDCVRDLIARKECPTE